MIVEFKYLNSTPITIIIDVTTQSRIIKIFTPATFYTKVSHSVIGLFEINYINISLFNSKYNRFQSRNRFETIHYVNNIYYALLTYKCRSV